MYDDSKFFGKSNISNPLLILFILLLLPFATLLLLDELPFIALGNANDNSLTLLVW